jgi:hypothetical protein
MGSKNIKIYFFIITQLYNNNYITIKQEKQENMGDKKTRNQKFAT